MPLIGVPTIVTVGRGLADGEVKDRRSGERTDVPVAAGDDPPRGRRTRVVSPTVRQRAR